MIRTARIGPILHLSLIHIFSGRKNQLLLQRDFFILLQHAAKRLKAFFADFHIFALDIAWDGKRELVSYSTLPVSYTHLDVYKRQFLVCVIGVSMLWYIGRPVFICKITENYKYFCTMFI